MPLYPFFWARSPTFSPSGFWCAKNCRFTISSEWACAILLRRGLITRLPAPYFALRLLVKNTKYARRVSRESWSEGYDDKLNEEETEERAEAGATVGDDKSLLRTGDEFEIGLTIFWRLFWGIAEVTTDLKLELLFSVIDKVDFGTLVLDGWLWACCVAGIGI